MCACVEFLLARNFGTFPVTTGRARGLLRSLSRDALLSLVFSLRFFFCLAFGKIKINIKIYRSDRPASAIFFPLKLLPELLIDFLRPIFALSLHDASAVYEVFFVCGCVCVSIAMTFQWREL